MTPKNNLSGRFLLSGFFGNWSFATGFLIFYYRELGFSFLQIFMLSVIYEGLNFILEIPTGVLADLWSVKKTVLIGHLISAGSFFLIAIKPDSYAVFVIWAVISAVCTTLNSGAMDTFIYETIRREDELGFARFQGRLTAVGLVTAAGTMVLGGVLTGLYGYRLALILSGIGGVIQTLILASFPDPTVSIRAGKPAAQPALFGRHLIESIRSIWQEHAIREVTILATMVFVLTEFFRTIFQPALTQIGIHTSEAIAAFTAGSMMLGSVCAILTGDRMDRIPGKWLRRALGVAIVLPLFLMAIPYGTLPAILLYSVSIGLCSTALPVITNRVVASEQRSTVYSTQNQIASISYAGFATLAGSILDAYPIWIVAPLAGLLGLVVLLPLLSSNRSWSSAH